jgi:hypothetical protein
MSRYTRIDDDDGLEPEECECGASEAHLYEDAGDEVWLCAACAGDHPACEMCGRDGADIQVRDGGPLVCRVCAAEEEGAA